MNSVIYNPLEEFDTKHREAHSANTNKFFESLVSQSGIDIEKNRETLRRSITISSSASLFFRTALAFSTRQSISTRAHLKTSQNTDQEMQAMPMLSAMSLAVR